MTYSNLYDLIYLLEKGTKLHIGVIFFGNYGNERLILPQSHRIHDAAACDLLKSVSYERCFSCRNLAIKRAIKSKEAFGGICVGGIYEYTHPVFDKDRIIALIYIGNIFAGMNSRLEKSLGHRPDLIETLEKDFDESSCKRMATLIESYIRLLIKEYPLSETSEFIPIIENLNSLVGEGTASDLSLSKVAENFNYNKKYFGRLFRQKTGVSFKDHINSQKIKTAKQLLSATNDTVMDIALKCGFNNVSYFNRVFKENCGMTPTEYRKQKLFALK